MIFSKYLSEFNVIDNFVKATAKGSHEKQVNDSIIIEFFFLACELSSQM